MKRIRSVLKFIAGVALSLPVLTVSSALAVDLKSGKGGIVGE